MARPSAYSPNTDFADYSAQNPTRPVRGQDLDVEFNGIQHSMSETQAWLEGITGDDGGLRLKIVTKYHLADDVMASLADDIYAQVAPTANQATSAASAAQVYASHALLHRNDAQTAADAAYGEGDRAVTARVQAETVLSQTQGVRNEALSFSIDASNWANGALGHANHAALARNEAQQWAEFIGGPVVEDALDPDAYDSGLWSAKWWAIQAARWAQGQDLDPEVIEGMPGPAGIAGPEGFGKVVYSVAELEALLGPNDGAVALVTEPPGVWEFKAGDTTAISDDVRAPADDTAGRWHKLAFAVGEGGGGEGMTSNEFYEQPAPPIGAQAGALWIDTSDEI